MNSPVFSAEDLYPLAHRALRRAIACRDTGDLAGHAHWEAVAEAAERLYMQLHFALSQTLDEAVVAGLMVGPLSMVLHAAQGAAQSRMEQIAALVEPLPKQIAALVEPLPKQIGAQGREATDEAGISRLEVAQQARVLAARVSVEKTAELRLAMQRREEGQLKAQGAEGSPS